ncbi:peptidylprolyl isomerase [Roseiterribacter gracilis]|uniref:peptidylprolyl isomerase n=1 Tax=Roseiterribacter gracilis TaxID=2812848 RepID=A0A8S8XDU8_9PROT|nr:peptidyl-prolyl cis-trans isomerase [Rhodospirillales bacterium TMPK1]
MKALVAALLFAATTASAQNQQPNARVEIHTDAGKIRIVLDALHAPITSCNFLRYVRAGAYNGGLFYRTVHKTSTKISPVPIEVIQAGARKEAENWFGPIALETTQKTGLHHHAGAISMARSDPNSATSSFFIVVEDSVALDFGGMRNTDGQGFAAFGSVIDGMDVVRAIHASPDQGEAIVQPVKMNSVTLIDPWPKNCGN